MYGLNYDGLRKKETYNELIDYVMNKQEKIKYPNRTAKFLRESPQLSNLLDGDGEGVLEMEEQQKRQMQEEQKEHNIRDMAGGAGGSAAELRVSGSGLVGEPVRVVPRPQFLSMSIPPSDYESVVADSEYGSAAEGSEPDATMSSLRDDISDEVFETEEQLKEKQEKAEAEAKLMLQTIYLGVAEKLANRPSPPSYSPTDRTKKTIDKKKVKKSSNKAGTGEAPASMDVDIVVPRIQDKKSDIAGSTGDPEGPSKRGRKTTIKTTDKKTTTRTYSRKRTKTPTFQEGGSSSSMAVVEVPPTVSVANRVKEYEAKPKASPPAKATPEQLGARSKSTPPAKATPEQLGARSKSRPPAKATPEQLGARSKSIPTAKAKAGQIGARSKSSAPRSRPSNAQLLQPGVVNV